LFGQWLLVSVAIQDLAVSIEDCGKVACLLPDSELDGGPLVVRNKEQRGLVLLRVVSGVKVEAGVVLFVKVQHEKPLYQEQVAFIPCVDVILRPALAAI